MSISTRREFVRSSAVAAAGMTVVGGLVAGEAEAAGEHHTAPVVAYVRNARKGEISVMAGDRTVSIRDRQLAARLVRAAR